MLLLLLIVCLFTQAWAIIGSSVTLSQFTGMACVPTESTLAVNSVTATTMTWESVPTASVVPEPGCYSQGEDAWTFIMVFAADHHDHLYIPCDTNNETDARIMFIIADENCRVNATFTDPGGNLPDGDVEKADEEDYKYAGNIYFLEGGGMVDDLIIWGVEAGYEEAYFGFKYGNGYYEEGLHQCNCRGWETTMGGQGLSNWHCACAFPRDGIYENMFSSKQK